jgi:hypothetical protein
MSDVGGSGYYVERKEKYWRQLGRLQKSADTILPRHLDAGAVAKVGQEAYAETAATFASRRTHSGSRVCRLPSCRSTEIEA